MYPFLEVFNLAQTETQLKCLHKLKGQVTCFDLSSFWHREINAWHKVECWWLVCVKISQISIAGSGSDHGGSGAVGSPAGLCSWTPFAIAVAQVPGLAVASIASKAVGHLIGPWIWGWSTLQPFPAVATRCKQRHCCWEWDSSSFYEAQIPAVANESWRYI